MPYPEARHAAPSPTSAERATRTVRFWVAPIAITVALLSALAALYLGGILNPTTNIRHFPIAVVNEDAGPTGQQIVDGLVNGLDKNKFDVRVLSAADAEHQLDTARVYGQLRIPQDISEKLQALAQSAPQPGQVSQPVVTISTNPRAGTLGASIANQTLSQAMGVVNGKVGERVSAEAALQTGGAPMAGGSRFCSLIRSM